MRILNAVYGDSTGGRWIAALKTAELLATAGHDVTLLLAPEDQHKIPIDFPAEIKVHTLRNHGHYDLIASWRARQLLQANSIDLCICHSGRAIYMLKRAARGIAPVVAFNHSHNIKRTLVADAFICITPFMKHLIDKTSAKHKPSEVISNAVSIPDVTLLQPKNNSVFTIGAIARMVPNKGLHHLIDALSLLKEQGIQIHARIAGDGEERESLLKQRSRLNLEQEVEFMGWIPTSAKTDFYNSVDVMCFTSEWDIQGLVILESFAYGKPLIATDIDGPSSMYVHEKNAYVVPPQDALALSKAIMALRDNDILRQKIAAAGRAKAIIEYSDASISRALETFCSSLIAEK